MVAEPDAPASLATIAATGDFRATLVALRDRLATELDTAKGPAVAALAKQLNDVLRQLQEMSGRGEESTVDDLAQRRRTRRATAATPAVPAKNVKRGAGGGRARS